MERDKDMDKRMNIVCNVVHCNISFCGIIFISPSLTPAYRQAGSPTGGREILSKIPLPWWEGLGEGRNNLFRSFCYSLVPKQYLNWELKLPFEYGRTRNLKFVEVLGLVSH